MREKVMKIPFENRDKYISVILELNQCISRKGAVRLWINCRSGYNGVYLIAEGVSNPFRFWTIMRKNKLAGLSNREFRYLWEAAGVDYDEILPLGMEESEEQIYRYLHTYDGDDGKMQDDG